MDPKTRQELAEWADTARTLALLAWRTPGQVSLASFVQGD